MIKERIADFLRSLVPVQRVIISDPRHETTGQAQTLDVDRALALFREADAGNPTDLFALYTEMVLSDTHLQTEISKRKLAVLGDALVVHPADKAKPEDVAAADAIRAMVEGYEPEDHDGAALDFDFAASALLDAALWPVVVMEKVYRTSRKPGLSYELAQLVPVPAMLLDFSTGKMRIKGTDPITGTPNGQFMEADRRRFIVHRGHLLSAPDFRGGPMRAAVVWWMLGTLGREWWARFLDRYGSPFLVGKYDQADDASRSILERAFQWAVKIGGLVVSRQTDVEVMQANTGSGGDAYEKFIAVCQREKSKLVLGQTLSSESQPLGIGGGAAKTHEGVRQDYRQFDAARLAKTFQRQLFRQYLAINGIKGALPSITWGGESTEAASLTGALLTGLFQAGLRVTDQGIEDLSVRVGIPLERSQAPAAAMSLGARSLLLNGPTASEAANESIAREGAADLSQMFRGALAPVRQMVLNARSPEDLQRDLLGAYADWPAARVARLIGDALAAFAANQSA